MKNKKKIFWTFILVLVLIVLWATFASIGKVPSTLLPSPQEVLQLFFSFSFWINIKGDLILTINRVLIGFLFSVLIGAPLGLLIGYYKTADAASSILIDFFRSIPVVALFPLFLILFGIGEITIIATSIWSGAFVMLVNGAYGAKHSNKQRQKMAKVFGGTTYKILIQIVFFDSLPYIFSGFRIAISMCLIVVVLSEMLLGSSGGLGQQIYDSALLFRSRELYATIILLGLLGYFVNQLVIFFEVRVIHWITKSDETR